LPLNYIYWGLDSLLTKFSDF